MPQSLPDYRRILVIATRQIGDVLLTTPLIAQARSLWPNAQVDVLGFTGTLGMLEGHPQVGRLIEVKPGSGWLQSLSLIRSLWRRYDLALVTQRSDRAHLYAWVAARVRSGLMPGEASLSWWKRRLLDHPLVVNGEDTHVVVEKLRLLDPWRVGTAARVEVIAPPSASLPPAPGGGAGRGAAPPPRADVRGARALDVALQAMADRELSRAHRGARGRRGPGGAHRRQGCE